MKIRWRIEPIPAPSTNDRVVASIGVREEMAWWSLGFSELRAVRRGSSKREKIGNSQCARVRGIEDHQSKSDDESQNVRKRVG